MLSFHVLTQCGANVKKEGEMKRILVSFALSLLIFGLSCKGSKTVDIGVTLPLTHPEFSPYAQEIIKGMDMAMADVNRQIRGKTLRLLMNDNQADPDVTVSLFEELSRTGVLAIIGPVTKDAAIKAVRTSQVELTPVFLPLSIEMSLYAPPTSRGPSGEPDAFMPIVDYFRMTEERRFFAWRSLVNSAYLGYSSAYLAIKDKGLSRAVVVENPGSDRSRELAAQFEYYFEKGGGRISKTLRYDPSSDTEAALAQKVMSHLGGAPTLLFLTCRWEESDGVIRAIRAAGWKNVIIGPDEWGYGSVSPFMGKTDPGECYFISQFNPFEEKISGFVERFQRLHGSLPGSAAALGYDTFMFVHETLSRTDNLSKDEFIRLIPHVSYDGVTGRTEYGKGYDPLAKKVYVMRLGRDGLELKAKLSVSPYRLEKAIFPEEA
jgi:branched-chain amino acid transport system substrate-binding protein